MLSVNFFEMKLRYLSFKAPIKKLKCIVQLLRILNYLMFIHRIYRAIKSVEFKPTFKKTYPGIVLRLHN